jgi:carbon-monoxide dehydrogenase medium subunit
MAPPLLALDAEVVIAGPQGHRRVPLASFFLGVRRTVLAPDEMLVELVVPAPAARSGGNYLRHTPRRELDIAVVGVASQLTLSDGVCAKARIALAAVAPTPVRATAAEQALEGQPVTPEQIERAAELAIGAAQPISDQRGPRTSASSGPRPHPPHADHGPLAGRPPISRRNATWRNTR